MTQKEIDKFLANTKVYVNGKSKEIQEKLFSFGYEWNSGEKTIDNIDCTFLFIDDKSIAYNNSMLYFSNCPSKEITADEILALELTEPSYRPFKDAEECWQEMLKHQPVGWLISKNLGVIKNVATITSNSIICPYPIGFDKGLENYLFVDGTPFGIKEE